MAVCFSRRDPHITFVVRKMVLFLDIIKSTH